MLLGLAFHSFSEAERPHIRPNLIDILQNIPALALLCPPPSNLAVLPCALAKLNIALRDS